MLVLVYVLAYNIYYMDDIFGDPSGLALAIRKREKRKGREWGEENCIDTREEINI